MAHVIQTHSGGLFSTLWSQGWSTVPWRCGKRINALHKQEQGYVLRL